MTIDQIWSRHEIGEGKPPVYITLDQLQVWIKYRDGEIWIAQQYSGEQADAAMSESPLPEDATWSRWAIQSEPQQVDIIPVFPLLPIVISSEFPLHISPDTGIQIYCRIPVWMRIGFRETGYVLTEFPTVRLSKTWFGTPFEGELCYRARTNARRSLEGVEPLSHYVNCPIHIRNQGREDLTFENFCLRVDQLSIYGVEDEMWAGETKIIHYGEDEKSSINMTGTLPSFLKEGRQLSEAHNPVQSGLVMRTFKKLFE